MTLSDLTVRQAKAADKAFDRDVPWAVRKDDVEIVRVFLEADCGCDPSGMLRIACLHNAKRVFRLLLAEWKADAAGFDDHVGVQPIHSAAEGDAFEIVEMLITEFGVDANRKAQEGWTPLHFAANANAARTVEVLLRHGADPTIEDDEGWPPIKCTQGEWEVHSVLAQAATGRR